MNLGVDEWIIFILINHIWLRIMEMSACGDGGCSLPSNPLNKRPLSPSGVSGSPTAPDWCSIPLDPPHQWSSSSASWTMDDFKDDFKGVICDQHRDDCAPFEQLDGIDELQLSLKQSESHSRKKQKANYRAKCSRDKTSLAFSRLRSIIDPKGSKIHKSWNLHKPWDLEVLVFPNIKPRFY